jgi:S-adenosylmethionine-diacylglycerol 3-amino-3-carboxypropyl transferase
MNPKANPIQFAVVREDPLTDARVLKDTPARRALLVGSGGCTAFSLQALFPQLEIRLVDPNPAQLELIRRKVQLLESGASLPELRQAFGAGRPDDPASLNGCGNFESLFRGLRSFLHEFVLPQAELEAMFESPERLAQGRRALLASRYWPVAFELYFSDPLLNAMFTENATQHAPRGSYPAYFRQVIERELNSRRALDNYFVHHVLLGHYLDRPASLPPYLGAPARKHRFEYVQATLEQLEDLEGFDLIHLSNVLDWMAPDQGAELARRVAAQTRRGAAVIYRQLNNSRDLRAGFAPRLRFSDELSAELLSADRSLFYCKIEAGFAL